MESHQLRPSIEISDEIRKQLVAQAQESGQVVIHFRYDSHPALHFPDKIRIWQTTYLEDQKTSARSELVHVENICLYPEWLEVPPQSQHFFTLIFKGLPKSVELFDMCEYCDGEGAPFVVSNIPRNDTDVYYVVMGRG